MTEEAQRIAIAEACGWTDIHQPTDKWRPLRGFANGKLGVVPDYLHDLNAMHEAEKTLGDMQIKNYVAILTNRSFVQDGDITRIRCWEALHATAAQRAEAFLRVIGKWEEHDK